MKSFMNIFIVTILIHQIVAFSTSDVCKNEHKLCKGKKSIACEDITLCDGAQIIELSDAEKQEIIDAHNKHRSDIANGNIDNFPSAVKMATIAWDNDLEAMADLNIRRCKFEHDKCRNTEKYHYSGQNLARSHGTALAEFDRSTVVSKLVPFVNSWFDEYKVCPLQVIQSFYSDPNIHWGHFTVMVADRNTNLGCAAVWYPEGDSGYINFACNYATTNMDQFPIYTEGDTASGCTTGANPQYNGLCSNEEQYEFNDFPKMYPNVEF